MTCLRPSFENPENVHIDQDCTELTGHHEDQLFHNCTFKKLNDLTLKDCVLNKSEFLTDKVEDALGFTITLNCHSFEDVKLSPLVFDLILVLLAKTKGNSAKRLKLTNVISHPRLHELLQQMKTLE